MPNLGYFILTNGLLASVLALMVWWTSRWIRRPALRHLLWVLVLLRLIAPPLLEVNLSGVQQWTVDFIQFSSEQQSGALRRTISDQPELIAAIGRAMGQPTVVPRRSVLPDSEEVAYSSRGDSVATLAAVRSVMKETTVFLVAACDTVALILFPIWCLGTAVCLMIQVLSAFRFRRTILRNAYQSRVWQARTERVAQQMQLRRCPQLLLVRATISPMLWGFGHRAKVLFPEKLLENLDRRAQNTLLAHELAHFRRGDQWVRLLELLATALFWWHPVLWWTRHEIEKAEERCCDAWAVRCANGRPRTYAEALLATVDFVSQRYSPPAVSSLTHTSFLRQRIRAIMQERLVGRRTLVPTSYPGVGALAALVLIPCPAFWAAMPAGPAVAVVNRLVRPAPAAGPLASLVAPANQDPKPLDREQARLTVDAVQRATFRNPRQNLELDLGVGQVASASFSEDGSQLVLGKLSGQLEVRSCDTGAMLRVVDVSHSRVQSVCFAPNNQLVAAGTSDGVCRLLNVRSPGADEVTRRRLGAAVRSVRFSRNGRFVAVLWSHPSYQQIEVWDLVSDRVTSSQPCDSGWAVVMDRSDGESPAWHVVAEDGRVFRWIGPDEYVALPRSFARQALQRLHLAQSPGDSVPSSQ